MKDKLLKFSENLRTYFSITKTELSVAILLLIGLILGGFLQLIDYKAKSIKSRNLERIIQIADSLEKQDSIRDSNDSLKILNESADALIYPAYKRKELPKEIINLNSANKFDLVKLPGVGEKMAEQIIEFRKRTKFKNTNDLKKVKGIGKKKFEKIKPFIKVQ